MFSLSIGLNFAAVALAWLSLRLHFGRKCTFLLANILASIFTLFTGFSFSSLGDDHHDISKSSAASIKTPSSASSSSAFLLFNQHQQDYHHLLPLLMYSLAKVCQAWTYLILIIWLYELLPPAADCSAALRAVFTVAHLHLALAMPLLLFAAVCRLTNFSFFNISFSFCSKNHSDCTSIFRSTSLMRFSEDHHRL